MNSGKLLAFGGAAAAVWYFFLRTPSVTTPATTTPVTGTTAPQSAGTLDAAYKAMLIKANGATKGSVDDWNAWLMQGTPSITAPDPLPIFTAAIPGFERANQLSAAEYWAAMSPVLKTNLGLSGVGFFGQVFGGGY